MTAFPVLAEVPRTPFSGSSSTSCTYRDLRPSLGPVRRQRDKGWCYANAAADLISFRFHNEMGGREASAGYIALKFNRRYLQTAGFNGGFARLALRSIENDGVCLRDREEEILERNPEMTLKMKVAYLEKLKENFDANQGRSLEADLDLVRGTNSILNEIPRENIRRVLESSDKRNFVSRFADMLCGNSRFSVPRLPDLHTTSKYANWGDTAPVMHNLHKQLDRGNIAAVSYFADFFEKDNAKPTNDGRHVSTLVGRRWRAEKGRCEVLIRNSWGASCAGYKAESIKSDPKACESGSIWVDEAVFMKYLVGATYFVE